MSFFFNDTATTEIYTLSLHDALPIWGASAPPTPGTHRGRAGSRNEARRYKTPRLGAPRCAGRTSPCRQCGRRRGRARASPTRSEEHTSELQSRQYLVCRLLLEKKKIK